ncbi:MAG: hypothetical protein KDF65_04085, partial [Anaerolineae bacterium]|nr:hypothetical protein [Anaerolineae bacterium]
SQLGSDDLVLFWRPLDHLPDDLILTLALTDDEGHTWHREPITGRPGAYFYPPSRWPTGPIVMTRYSLPWQIGTPPGLYVAEVGLGQPAPDSAAAFQSWDILDEQGRPQRQTALIDHVNVSHLVQPAGEPLPIAADPQIDFMPIVAIRRSIMPETSAEPGQRLLLALLWQAGQFNADDISVAFDLIDAEGQTFRVGSSLTPSRRYNLPRWQPGEVVLGQYWLDIPPAAAPGPAALQLHLVNSSGFVYDEVFPLETLEIKPSQRNFEPPARLDHPLDAVFGRQISLLGLDCAAGCRARPGETISLTLHWRAEATPDKSYTVFTHLLDAAETVRVNADHAPPKPSQGWLPGEIITDPVTLTLPPDLPPGDYAVEIGLYDAADPAFTRLPLSGGETRVLLPGLVEVD